MNLPMCRWLRNRRRRGDEVCVLFHEPYFYFGWHRPWRNLLAVVNRVMAWTLMQGAGLVYLSTPTWERYLRPYAWPSLPRFQWLPFPATLPVIPQDNAVRALRTRASASGAPLVGHFGTYGHDIAQPLRAIIRELLAEDPAVHLVCIGRNSERFIAEFDSLDPSYRRRIQATGDLEAAQTSLWIQACNLMIQPYPDGVTARRTSMTNLLAHGSAVITTDGRLTEPMWRSSGLSLVGTVEGPVLFLEQTLRLLRNDESRRSSSIAALNMYDRYFCEQRLLEALRPSGSSDSRTNRAMPRTPF